MTRPPSRGRGSRFRTEHRAALLRLSARPPQVPAGRLTDEQERAFRARTRRVGMIGVWYAAAAAELHRSDRRPAGIGLPPAAAGADRSETDGPTAAWWGRCADG
ncbi:hypothetical protein [Frankia sp. AvcI1]|uniref:hypothetical protein n=1 Tax=Frankia sp. AvcI1 TaxID=573496 RepID=UPI0006EC10BB|nr:hypothetical protein [Frankia sp. AvcI1]